MADTESTRYDAIILGAGFGGSACAGLLAKRGLKVLLLDKNAIAGGKAMSLSKNGFTFTAFFWFPPSTMRLPLRSRPTTKPT